MAHPSGSARRAAAATQAKGEEQTWLRAVVPAHAGLPREHDERLIFPESPEPRAESRSLTRPCEELARQRRRSGIDISTVSRFGKAISPFSVSAMSHTRCSEPTAPR